MAKTGHFPWSWLFLIEGCVAIGIGIFAFMVLPRLPDDLQKNGGNHWLFTKEEIDLAVVRFACRYGPMDLVLSLTPFKHITLYTNGSSQNSFSTSSEIPNRGSLP
jgi:hypothetical protein